MNFSHYKNEGVQPANINNGHMNVTELEVYKVAGMCICHNNVVRFSCESPTGVTTERLWVCRPSVTYNLALLIISFL